MSAPALGAGLPVFHAVLDGTAVGAEVALAPEEARHAGVRRVREGEPLLLTDGAGRAVTARVVLAQKSALSARVEQLHEVERPRPELCVVQAIPKGERADLAVEALTEVGVDRIVAFQAQHCVAVWRGERAEKSLGRWRTSAREAAKQARRVWWPEVTGPAHLADVVGLVAAADLAVVLHESARLPMAELSVPLSGSVVVVVGPEGGLAEAEVSALHEAGAHVCRLGDTVLRTSTAGLAACSALLAQTTRWA